MKKPKTFPKRTSSKAGKFSPKKAGLSLSKSPVAGKKPAKPKLAVNLPITNTMGDVREMTRSELSKFKPAKDVLPAGLFNLLPTKKGRGPGKKPKKEAMSIRLDRDVKEHYQNLGPKWQTRINQILRDEMTK